MQKNYKIALAVCCFMLILIGIGGLAVLHQSLDTSIYIFSDIKECQTIETLDAKVGRFQKYQDTAFDKHANDLKCTAFFGGEYSCDVYSFQIFAYVFEDTTTAQEYFERTTGKVSDSLSTNFSLASGVISSHLVVFDGKHAYAVYFPTSATAEVLQLLSVCFETKIA